MCRTSSHRRAVGPLTFSLFLALCSAAAAQLPVAEFTPGPQSVAAVPAPNVAASIPTVAEVAEPAIEYYMKSHRVDRTEARRRLALQVRDPALQDKLIGQVGGQFVQLWFDDELGRLVLALSPEGDVPGAERSLRSLGFAVHEYVVKRVLYDASEFITALHQARDALGSALATGDASVGQGAGVLQVGVSSSMSRAARDQIVARVTRAAGRFNVGVVVSEISDPSPPPAVCVRPYCNPVVAGVQWNPTGCSLAFYVGSPPGTGHFFLTAGHCLTIGNAPPGSAWSTCAPSGGPCTVSGAVVGGYYNGGDAAVVRVDHFGFGLYPGWVNWWSGGVTRLAAGANPLVGYVLCHNGRVAGSSCGTVQLVNWSFVQGGVSLYGMAGISGSCVIPGDSGGPWTYASWAYAAGITNGGTCNGSTWAAAEPIGRAVSTLNVVLYG
jgi:hypothetical protein